MTYIEKQDEHVIEQIGEYLAGGGTDAERESFEAHLARCADCAEQFKSLEQLDAELQSGLATVKADEGLEQRIRERLKYAIGPLASSRVRRAAATAAAVLIVGAFGWIGQEHLKTGSWPAIAVNSSATVPSDLRQIGNSIALYGNENKSGYPRRSASANLVAAEVKDGQSFSYGDGRTEFQKSPFSNVQRDLFFSQHGTADANAAKSNAPFAQPYDANDSVLLPVDDDPKLSAAAKDSTLPALAPADAKKESESTTPAITTGLSASTQPADGSMLIREGTIEFEVDSFESCLATIRKVAAEQRADVAAVNSDKLPNGKVRGTITLRVPPDQLDVLVLKLRALGDLKTQRLGSTDITKQYTDLQGQLRAAQAMQERLLDLIKTGQGKVKDLLEAENELGKWREKIETIQGQLNYFNNRVSLATLTLAINERNVTAAALATRKEQITAGVQLADVERGRAELLKAIDSAGGRVVESALQQLDAGQLSAKIVADVSQEKAGAITDRLRQLGTVTRLDAQRSETNDADGPASLQSAKVQTQPTRLIISLFNVTNLPARVTTNLGLACGDVEKSYRQAIERVARSNGRLIKSDLNHGNDGHDQAELQFEVQTAEASGLLTDLRGAGQVTQLNDAEATESPSVTGTKQAFVVQFMAADQLPPRQTRTITNFTSDVVAGQQKLMADLQTSGAKIISSSSDGNSATVIADVPLDKSTAAIAIAGVAAKTTEVHEDQNVPVGALSRVRLTFVLNLEAPLVSESSGVWTSVRSGLATSLGGLLWSLQLLTIGLFLVAPWAALVAGGWWLIRKKWFGQLRQDR